MMNTGYTAYNSTNVETADQGKLILIAYDVAIKHCKLVIPKFDDKKLIEERTKHLCKIQDAITELMSSLNLDVGEIARNLYRLYDYMLRRCLESNIKNDKKMIIEILGYLEDLRDAWSQAIVNVRMEAAPKKENSMQNFAITC
jgi:flagellar secretion chaperone FliS